MSKKCFSHKYMIIQSQHKHGQGLHDKYDIGAQ